MSSTLIFEVHSISKMINWLLICGIAFGSMAVAEKSNSNYIVVFTETYIKMNATYGNSTHSIGKDSNVTVTLNSTQLIRNGTVRLELQLKKPTDEVFITTLNYTLDWCYFMDYPFTEPLVYTVYEQAKRDRRNHLFGKCPLKPVWIFLFLCGINWNNKYSIFERVCRVITRFKIFNFNLHWWRCWPIQGSLPNWTVW